MRFSPPVIDPLPKKLVQAWLHGLKALRPRGLNPKMADADFVREMTNISRDILFDLWQAYNTDREELGSRAITTAPVAAAYGLGFHLGNTQRARVVMKRAWQRHPEALARLKEAPLYCLDLGCGTGALTQGVVESLRPHQVRWQELELWDQSRPLLEMAEASTGKLVDSSIIRTWQGRLNDPKLLQILSKKLEKIKQANGILIVGLGYLLNEVTSHRNSEQAMTRILDRLIASKTPLVLVILEPGREKESRPAMYFREALVQQGLQCLYPCPLSKPCPMLKTHVKDWCYSEVPDHNEALWHPIARWLKLKRTKLAVSGYVLCANLGEIKVSNSNIVGKPLVSGYPATLLCKGNEIERVPLVKNKMRGETI